MNQRSTPQPDRRDPSGESKNQGFQFSRRGFLHLSGAAAAAWSVVPFCASGADTETAVALQDAIAKLEYLTPVNRAFILDKGKAGVPAMPAEKMREIGQTPETWSLEVIPDPASNSLVEQPLSRAQGNALNWEGLMRLAEKHAVRFLHLCTCTNGKDPFHMSLWEGVPLREVVSMTRPKDNVRRVYYQSYHPDNLPPFQSSLALSQVLEEPPGQLPVILAYKMNGQVIPPSCGGPVRMVAPGTYGNKSIKWVRRVLLTNDFKANDSDADLNNDPENPMKTRARFIDVPKEIAAGKPAPIVGMAQIGVSGLKHVQYCIRPHSESWPAEDPRWTTADWKNVPLLPPPTNWGGGLPGGKLPPTLQTDFAGKLIEWPLRYTIAHWAVMLPGLPAGNYDLCCRTIDGNGIAQPLPRALPRTGFNTLHVANVLVKA